MASNSSSDSDEQHDVTLDPPPRTRSGRQRTRHEGPPQLQFLTATNPVQFRGQGARRSVRSHAMRYHRHQAGMTATNSQRALEMAPAARASTPTQRSLPTVVSEYRYDDALLRRSSSESDDHSSNRELPQRSRSPIWTEYSLRDGGSSATRLQRYIATSPVSDSGLSNTVAHFERTNRVLDYEESDAHEERMMSMLMERLVTHLEIESGGDPSFILPQFQTVGLESHYLLSQCMRAFQTATTFEKWIPEVMSQPRLILGMTILTSAWLDMQAGCIGDSDRTTTIKAEIRTLIHERMDDPNTRFTDSTLIVMLELLFGEMWNCDEGLIRTFHQSGINILITERGGINRLENAVAEVAAACCYHCDIIREARPSQIFQEWEPPQTLITPIEASAAFPESPLFCPRTDFMTIKCDSQCSGSLYELIHDMRELTDLFIAHDAGLENLYCYNLRHATHGTCFSPEYDTRVSEIRARLISLPSAYSSGHPMTGDWTYETCRMASLIFMASVLLHIPFSTSADPAQNPFFTDSRRFQSSAPDEPRQALRLSELLFEALMRTDTANIWGDMCGVFYWVCAVGAASARTAATFAMEQRSRSKREAYEILVRRSLVIHGARSVLLLGFQHPFSIISAQKRLLEVQRLVGIRHEEGIGV